MADLDANEVFEVWVASRKNASIDEPIAESRDQETARLIAPRGRTPDQADAAEVYSIYTEGRSDAGLLSSEPVGGSSSALAPGIGLFGTAPDRESKKASHKVVSAFEDKASFEKATENLGPLQLVEHWQPPKKAAPYLDKVREVEEIHGMPENLMAALVNQESQWDPKAKSLAGAKGLTQLMPVHKIDTDDTDASIEYGAEYLAKMKDKFGTWELALAAYNWGPGNLKREGIEKAPKETLDYIKRILGKVHLDEEKGG